MPESNTKNDKIKKLTYFRFSIFSCKLMNALFRLVIIFKQVLPDLFSQKNEMSLLDFYAQWLFLSLLFFFLSFSCWILNYYPTYFCPIPEGFTRMDISFRCLCFNISQTGGPTTVLLSWQSLLEIKERQ